MNLGTAEQSRSAEKHILVWDISSGVFKRLLVWLGLFGLATRLFFFVQHAGSPSFCIPTLDQKYYDMVARMLLSGQDLHELHGFRPLLYPLFLAFFYKLGGAAGAALTLAAQHILGIVTGLLVAVLGARLFNNHLCGLAGGLLYLLAPVPLYFEGELLIEPSYVFLIVVALLVHVWASSGQGWKSGWLWLVGGALVALAAQARANILIFLAMYPLMAFRSWWRIRGASSLLPLAGLVGALGMMIPWGVVNMRQTDHFHLIPNGGAVNLFLGNRHGADGMFTGEDVVAELSKASENGANSPIRRINSGGRYQDLVEVWAAEEYESAMQSQGRAPADDPMAISQYWSRRTLDEIRAAPAAWLRLTAKKCWLMLWNVEVPNNKAFAFLQEEFSSLRWLPVRWVVLLMLLPAGFWIASRFQNCDALFILSVYLFLYFAGDVAFFICDRYRYPLWPAAAVLAGGGFWWMFESLRARKWKSFLGAGAAAVLMAAISLPNWFAASLPNFSQDYYFHSSAWYERGHLAEALKDANCAAELNPRDGSVQQHLGNIFFAMSRLPEARAAYERALQLLPGDSGIWNNLGATLDALGDTDGALRAFERATESRLPCYSAFFGKAFVQIRLNQLDAAAANLAEFEQLQKTPDASDVALRSVIARRRGNTRDADELEARARRLDAEAADWAIKTAAKEK